MLRILISEGDARAEVPTRDNAKRVTNLACMLEKSYFEVGQAPEIACKCKRSETEQAANACKPTVEAGEAQSCRLICRTISCEQWTAVQETGLRRYSWELKAMRCGKGSNSTIVM